MQIDVRSNIDEAKRKMYEMARTTFPSAVGRAIDATAALVEKEIVHHTKAVVDRPVPFTTNRATYLLRTQQGQRVKTATVGIKDIQSSYLTYLEHGGTSRPKQGKAKPVPNTKSMNQYGNLPRGMIARIIKNKSQYFSGTPSGGKGVAGVYKRLGNFKARERVRDGNTSAVYRSHGLQQVVHWQTATTHRKLARYDERVQIIVQRNFARELTKELKAKGIF